MKKACKGLRSIVVLAVAFFILVAEAAYSNFSAPDAASVICVEAGTGLVLYEQNAEQVRPPASMIKLMQMLMVVEGVDGGLWSLHKPIRVSRKAQGMGGTQVYLAAGETYPLEQLMRAVAIASANDAAMAVAEGLWGSERAYLEAMNARARSLGMESSEFHSVHGLPPDRGELPDRTTAHDMALLARECVKHPQLLEWTTQDRVKFRPGLAVMLSTNKLLRRMPECDGLKTGYIRASGHCITATAKREGLRIIVVIMGHTSSNERFRLAERLLYHGLDNITRGTLVSPDVTDVPAVPVENATIDRVQLEITEDIGLTLKTEDWERLRTVIEAPQTITAPVIGRTPVGEVRVELDGEVLASTDLIVPETIDEAPWLFQFQRRARQFFGVE